MTQPLEPKDPYPSLRDEKGRFVPGGPGGPGRTRKRDEYLAAWHAGCSVEDMTEIARSLTLQAKHGDQGAATLLARYLLPAPARSDDGDPAGYVALLTAEQHALLRAQLKEELRREMQAEREASKLAELERQWNGGKSPR